MNKILKLNERMDEWKEESNKVYICRLEAQT